MPVTSPDSIDYPDTSYTGGIVAAMAAQATSVQAAFDTRAVKSYRWADSSARLAQTGMNAGDEGWQIDTAVRYSFDGTDWQLADLLPHEEWTTTSASTASASASSVGTFTRDAGTSNVSGMFTISTNTLTAAASGLYDLTVTCSLTNTPTGTTWVRLYDGTDYYFAHATTVSAAWGNAIFAGLRVPASTVLTATFFHTSAANRVLTARWRATKVGTY